MTDYKVVDVSKWNPYFNAKKITSLGINHIFIRAGYGNGKIDPYADKHYLDAINNGMKVGFYWFSYARSEVDAIKEADHLLAYVKDKKCEMPLVFDFESASMQNRVMDKGLLNRIAQAFLDRIENAGYYAMLYSNEDFIKRIWSVETKKKYDIWYARYTSNSKYAEPYYLWQYTSNFKIEGKAFDMSIAKRDYPAIIKKAGLNHV